MNFFFLRKEVEKSFYLIILMRNKNILYINEGKI